MWNKLTFLWNDLTIEWNDLNMERNDRKPNPTKVCFVTMIFLDSKVKFDTRLLCVKRFKQLGQTIPVSWKLLKINQW